MTAVHHQREAAPATGRIPALAARFGLGEPHLARGPFTRWPRATDALVVLVVFVATLVAVAVSRLEDGEALTAASVVDRPVGSLVLVALASGALWWRRTWPVASTVFVLAVAVLWAVAGYGDGEDLPLVVAVYGVGRYGTDDRHSVATVVAAFGVGIVASVVDSSQRVDVLPAFILTALPWYVGRRVRNRGEYLTLLRERAERLEAEQQARARRAVAAERARIARELHDVVAHEVSMMTVQAGAAKTIARDDLDAAVEAMGDVERAGRRALGELRLLLGVLRRDSADPDQLGPQPGIADVTALVDELVRTGAAVTVTVGDLPERLATALDLSAYRIVQESCTNIVKHAGPGPTVAVEITVDDDALVIDIVNTVTDGTATAHTAGTTGGAAGRGLPVSGYGTAGMRERASLLGGTLVAGPETSGRFRVHARLPLEPEPT